MIHRRGALFFAFLLFSPAPAAPFKTVAFHYTSSPSPLWLQENKARVKSLAALGYNPIILQCGNNMGPFYKLRMGAGHEDGVPVAEIANLISFARKECQTEIIFEIKVLGKAKRTFGEPYIKAHPTVVVKSTTSYGEDIWNPQYVNPTGGSLYEGVVYPLLVELLEAYGTVMPAYLFLGTDEADKGALLVAADRMGLTRGQLMAKEFNAVTSFLLARGITPILWADMITSHRLAEINYIAGWAGDPRFSQISELNGDSDHFGGGSLMDGVLAISNREKIIACDWHYFEGTTNGEYPCLDYLKWLGFKEVWFATWYSEKNITSFSRYAAKVGCQGAVATSWHTTVVPYLTDIYETTAGNSIPIFQNPNLPMIQTPRLFVTQADSLNQATFSKEKVITLKVETAGHNTLIPGIFSLRISGSTNWGIFLEAKPNSSSGVTSFVAELPLHSPVRKQGLWDVKYECRDSHKRLVQTIENGLFYIH